MKEAYICPETKVVGTLGNDAICTTSYDVDNSDDLGNEHGTYEDTDEEIEIM